MFIYIYMLYISERSPFTYILHEYNIYVYRTLLRRPQGPRVVWQGVPTSRLPDLLEQHRIVLHRMALYRSVSYHVVLCA